jgi:hypothetical protein
VIATALSHEAYPQVDQKLNDGTFPWLCSHETEQGSELVLGVDPCHLFRKARRRDFNQRISSDCSGFLQPGPEAPHGPHVRVDRNRAELASTAAPTAGALLERDDEAAQVIAGDARDVGSPQENRKLANAVFGVIYGGVAVAPGASIKAVAGKLLSNRILGEANSQSVVGAGDEIRTRDFLLGKQTFYR